MVEKTPKDLFREFLVQRANSLKGSFTLKELMKKIQWKSPEFQRVFSALVEEAFSSDEPPFVEVGASKDNMPVFIPKEELLRRCQSVFTKQPFVLSETETEEALKAISQSEQVHQQSLIHSITSNTCLIRFDQGSRGKPITLNLFQRFLASGNLLVTPSVLNHQMVYTSTSQKLEGKGRFRKETQPDENPQKMIQSAISVFLEEIGSLIFPESMLEAMSFKRYFAIENHNELEKLFYSLYPDVFHRSEGLWSFFPEQWLDLKAIIRRGITNRQSPESVETEIKNQHGFLHTKEVQWIVDIITQKIEGAPIDRPEKTTVVVEPSEELPAVREDTELDDRPEAQEVKPIFAFEPDAEPEPSEVKKAKDIMDEMIPDPSPGSGQEDSEESDWGMLLYTEEEDSEVQEDQQQQEALKEKDQKREAASVKSDDDSDDDLFQGIVTDFSPEETDEKILKEPESDDQDEDRDKDESKIWKVPETEPSSQEERGLSDQNQPKAAIEEEEESDLLKDLLIGFSSPQIDGPSTEEEPVKEAPSLAEDVVDHLSASPEPPAEEKKPEPIPEQKTETADHHTLSGKMIALLTDDQELYKKVLSFSEQMHIHLRDSLAYQPHFAILDRDYEYLSAIAKSSGIKVMTVSKFTEQYLQPKSST